MLGPCGGRRGGRSFFLVRYPCRGSFLWNPTGVEVEPDPPLPTPEEVGSGEWGGLNPELKTLNPEPWT